MDRHPQAQPLLPTDVVLTQQREQSGNEVVEQTVLRKSRPEDDESSVTPVLEVDSAGLTDTGSAKSLVQGAVKRRTDLYPGRVSASG
ncbi:hypothetical protein BU204_24995 [Actinophytocola xanthii]|uniref:Uncharacterized protein n=1 Tax=Actinophytocola xanthii TaxID=1912961 RepID=A0A1Q8CKE4_9PSEU|nr:hypothetical protein BU204_24995 [Actinophytocola xanthii]